MAAYLIKHVVLFICFTAVLSESTALGLKHYASINLALMKTARYIDFVSNIWKIMSANAPYKCKFGPANY